MIDREQEKAMCAALQALNDCLMALAVEGTGDAKGDFLCVKKLFDERERDPPEGNFRCRPSSDACI